MMSNNPARDFCPYKGLQPYTEEDRKYFFGRERDQAVIASNLYAAPLTVLYGASGVGKSSVLLAGVVPQLRGDPHMVVVAFRTWQGTSYRTALKEEVLRALREAGRDAGRIDLGLPFDEFLAACNKALPFRGRILFIFDQFEEYFLNPADPQARDGFDAEFARAVNGREVPANFLLSMRDDGLSKLDRFQGRIPNLLTNLLRVEHLNREDGRRAILKPLDIYNSERPTAQQITVEDGLVTALLDKAKPELDGERGASPAATSDAAVETPVLQILLTRLWKEERKHSSNCLRLSTFNEHGAENIVSEYLSEVMNSLTDGEREVASHIFQFLVTPAKTKIAHEPASLAEWSGQDARRVQALLDRLSAKDDKILRKVQVAGQPLRYEIFHDVLGRPISEWREEQVRARETAEAERRAAEAAEKKTREESMLFQFAQFKALAEEQQKRAEAERSRAEEAQRRVEAESQRAEEAQRRVESERRRVKEKERFSRRLLWALGSLVVLFILAAMTTAYAIKQRQVAENQRRGALVAAEQERRAKSAAEEAVMKESEARYEAESQKVIADEQRKKAEEQREKAEEQTKLAQAAEKKEEVAKRRAELAAAEAKKAMQEAVQARRHEEAGALINRLYYEAVNHYLRGESDEALRAFEEALNAFREENDEVGEANVLNNIGGLYRQAGEDDKAVEYYQKAIELYRRRGDKNGEMATLVSLASVYENSPGKDKELLYVYDDLLRFYRETNRREQEVNLLKTIGKRYGDRKDEQDKQTALKYYSEALELAAEIKMNSSRIDTLDRIAKLYAGMKHMQEAIKYYMEEFDLAQQSGVSNEGKIELLENIADLYEKLGDKQAAEDFRQRAEKLKESKPE